MTTSKSASLPDSFITTGVLIRCLLGLLLMGQTWMIAHGTHGVFALILGVIPFVIWLLLEMGISQEHCPGTSTVRRPRTLTYKVFTFSNTVLICGTAAFLATMVTLAPMQGRIYLVNGRVCMGPWVVIPPRSRVQAIQTWTYRTVMVPIGPNYEASAHFRLHPSTEDARRYFAAGGQVAVDDRAKALLLRMAQARYRSDWTDSRVVHTIEIPPAEDGIVFFDTIEFTRR